jgi:Uma2 family endonuclease
MRDEIESLTSPLVLHLGEGLVRLSDDEFYRFCQLHRDLRFERTRDGDLIVMPPTGGKTGRRNTSLTAQLATWSELDGSGVAFDSSTGFRLPLGGDRSPDASWVRRGRWEALTSEEREQFPPLAPDFVVELRSKSDSVDDLKVKMREYVRNGVRLGWLIDPYSRTVWVYRPKRRVERLDAPSTLSGDPELLGFELRLDQIWA